MVLLRLLTHVQIEKSQETKKSDEFIEENGIWQWGDQGLQGWRRRQVL